MLPGRNGPPTSIPGRGRAGHVFRADAAKELKVLKLDFSEQVLTKGTLVDALTSSFMGQFYVTVRAVVRVESQANLGESCNRAFTS